MRAQCVELNDTGKDSHMPRKRTPNFLRQSEARLRRLAESNVIGVAVGDLNGKIIEANDAFLKVIGYSRQELASGMSSGFQPHASSQTIVIDPETGFEVRLHAGSSVPSG